MRQRRPRLPVLAIALAIVMALGFSAPPAQAADCPGADELPAGAAIAVGKAATLCLLNVQRVSAGLAPLADDEVLDAAATRYSVAMVQQRFFAHVSPTGQLLEQRLAPYFSGTQVWDVGENLAWGEAALATPRAIVAGWMNSAPHRANILSARFAEIGIGIVNGSPIGSAPTASATYATEFGMLGGASVGPVAAPRAVPAATKRRITARCSRSARRNASTRTARSIRTQRCVRTRMRALSDAR